MFVVKGLHGELSRIVASFYQLLMIPLKSSAVFLLVITKQPENMLRTNKTTRWDDYDGFGLTFNAGTDWSEITMLCQARITFCNYSSGPIMTSLSTLSDQAIWSWL